MTLEAAAKILKDSENFANATPYEQALYTVLRDLQARVCKPELPMREKFPASVDQPNEVRQRNYHLAVGDRDYPLRSLHDHYCAYQTLEEARLHIEDAARDNVSSFGWWSISRLRDDGKMEDVEGGSVDCFDGKTVTFN